MLVVTANWGIADGTLVAAARRSRAARGWLRDVRAAVIRAGIGRDGVYRPPLGLDVVLAGDTFDCLTSMAWCGRERPWHRGASVRATRLEVLSGCGRRAAPLLAGLVRLARSGLAAPAADRRGRPAAAALVRVPVRVVLLCGDRDRDLAEAAAAGAARDVTVAPVWSDGTILVRHGHEFDPACHQDPSPPGDDRPPTLAESVAVELVAPFAASLTRLAVPRPAVAALVEMLAGAGPVDLPAIVSAWTAADGPGAALDAAARGDVVTAWRRAVDVWRRSARRSPPESDLPASPLEALAAWFAGDAGPLPPTALAGLFDRRLSSAVGPVVGATTVVLGHPSAAVDATATICLGKPPLRRWGPVTVVREGAAVDVACVVAAPIAVGPATIVGRRDGDRLAWQRMDAAGVAGAEGAATAAIVDAA